MSTWFFPPEAKASLMTGLCGLGDLHSEGEENLEWAVHDTCVWTFLRENELCLRREDGTYRMIHLLDSPGEAEPKREPAGTMISAVGNDFVIRFEPEKKAGEWKLIRRGTACLDRQLFLLRDKDRKGIARLEFLEIELRLTDLPYKEKLAPNGRGDYPDSTDLSRKKNFLRLRLRALRGYEEEAGFAFELVKQLRTEFSGPYSKAGYGQGVGHGRGNEPALVPGMGLLPRAFPLSSGMKAREAVIGLSLQMLDTARFFEKGILRRIDDECLHQYRVSLRKTRAILSLLKGVFPEDEESEWKSEIAGLMKHTNRLRDLDVQIEDLKIYEALIPEAYRGGIENLIERTKRSRLNEQDKVTEYFSSEEYRRRIEEVRNRIAGVSGFPETESGLLLVRMIVDRAISGRRCANSPCRRGNCRGDPTQEGKNQAQSLSKDRGFYRCDHAGTDRQAAACRQNRTAGGKKLKTLAFYSIKGGVGKTTMAVNTAHHAAVTGHKKTLLIDLDPQGSAGFYFRVKPGRRAKGKDLLRGDTKLHRLIRESDYPLLDIIPAARGLRNLDRYLYDEARRKKKFEEVLEMFDNEYQRIIIDCPSQFGLTSENIFRAADTILVPVIPSVLSRRTLDQLLDFFYARGYRKEKVLAFFSLVDARKKLHRETMTIMAEGPVPFLSTAIPYVSDMEKMGVHRAPVAGFAGRSRAGKAIMLFTGELEERGVL